MAADPVRASRPVQDGVPDTSTVPSHGNEGPTSTGTGSNEAGRGFADGQAGSEEISKLAVILVHGMGEQIPMETLRGFVETMWVRDPDIDARRRSDPSDGGNPVWWKPDMRSGTPELSRVTTRAGHLRDARVAAGPRTDFYELYWADLTEGNTLAQFRDWFLYLLCRSPRAVPPNVMPIWLTLWFATAAFGSLWAWKAASKLFPSLLGIGFWPNLVLTLATLAYSALIGFALAYFGDVPRYTRAAPSNIAARRAIRERGLALLRAVDGSGQYGRIVLVGHSLGSILAYDLVKLLWSEREAARTMRSDDAVHRAFLAVRDAADMLSGAGAVGHGLDAYQEAQTRLFAAMRGRQDHEPGWPISDLVTVGSPLAHAQFLLERDAVALGRGIAERRFPTNPPVAEDADGFLYQPSRTDPDEWRAHHAAPFAAVRWTNIHDAPTAIVLGDCISGPVGPILGRGTRDVRVTMRRKWAGRLFTHTLYWTDTGRPAPQLGALRSALDLVGRRTAA